MTTTAYLPCVFDLYSVLLWIYVESLPLEIPNLPGEHVGVFIPHYSGHFIHNLEGTNGSFISYTMGEILGFGQLLERERLEGSLESYFSESMSAGRHLNFWMSDLLDLSRIEAAKGVSFGELLHTQIYVDPVHIKQVLMNLLANAIRYERPSETVTVVVQLTNDAVLIEVETAGEGITRESHDVIFEPFRCL